MSLRVFLLLLVSFLCRESPAQNAQEKYVLQVVEDFFVALEKQDTTAFRKMFLKDAHGYAVVQLEDSVIVRGQSAGRWRFNPEQILKERLREKTTSVKIEGRIAMVWAPYDLWVNETFSHCGVDVFTLIKTSDGWRIASISYTVEKNGCR